MADTKKRQLQTRIAALDSQTAYTQVLNFENMMNKRLGYSRLQRYHNARRYYAGENLPPENVDTMLQVNFARPIINKHVSYLFGQWKKNLFSFEVKPKNSISNSKKTKSVDTTAITIQQFCQSLYQQNKGDTFFTKIARNTSTFGDAIIKVHWNNLQQKIVWQSILPEHFFCRWDPFNPQQKIEVIVQHQLPRGMCEQIYRTQGDLDVAIWNGITLEYGFATVWERWTPMEYQLWVDNVQVKRGPNPYCTVVNGEMIPGIIPFVHIPNMEMDGEFYGYSDFEPAEMLQDEYNRRISDMGDIINNHAHPIVLLHGFKGDIPDLPVGPDALWPMPNEGDNAEYLEWKGQNTATQEYLETLKNLIFMDSAMTEVAFGEHKGTQRSGVSLSNQMLPVIERANEKRTIWNERIPELILYSAWVYQSMQQLMINQELPVLPFELADLTDNYDLEIFWFPMLPKDQMVRIQENVTLRTNFLRSIRESLIDLGETDPDNARDEIIADIKELAKYGVQMQLGGKNTPGQGGNSQTDNSTDAKESK